MQVISAQEWVSGSEYLPAVRINKPISDFAAQFNTAVAPLKSGTPGLRFRSGGNQFILREVADEDTTELLVPMIDAAQPPRGLGKVEASVIAAMKDLRLRLPQVAALHKDLNREPLEWVLGFGLRTTGPALDLRPIQL